MEKILQGSSSCCMSKCWVTNYTYEDYIKDKQKTEYIKKIRTYTVEDILICREKRVFEQKRLIEFYEKTLIFMNVNYPGIIKNNNITFGIMKFMNKSLIEKFNPYIVYKNFIITAEGPVLTLIVNKDSRETKKITVYIEDKYFLGRYVDISVYDKNNSKINREMVGLKPKRCYICGGIKKSCIKSQTHSIEEIKKFIKGKYEDYCKWHKVF